MDLPARLEADGLGLDAGGRAILDGVALRVAPGELVGLVGPNGAGKTTLLRAISGLLAPTRGRVRLEGAAVERADPAAIARAVAHVPQSTTIDFGFTCLEVVLMGRHPHLGRFALEGPADYRLAEAAMAFTETSELAERPVTQVSGGERQRVIAARALAQEPRLLLLDEPTANLDVLHQLQLLELVRELVRQRRLSAIAAIHDLELAARYCDRLVLLKQGRVLASGEPAEVLTPERIQAAFGARAIVRPEPITGALSIVVLSERAPRNGRSARLHVIAGGGNGARPLYLLQAAGYRVSAGVLAENDTDYQAARLLGVETVSVPPFSAIDQDSLRRNAALIAEADCVVVCAIPFGQGNLANLEAAAAARRLVLIDPQSIGQRDHTGGRATALYRALLARGAAASLPELVQRVEAVLEGVAA